VKSFPSSQRSLVEPFAVRLEEFEVAVVVVAAAADIALVDVVVVDVISPKKNKQ